MYGGGASPPEVYVVGGRGVTGGVAPGADGDFSSFSSAMKDVK